LPIAGFRRLPRALRRGSSVLRRLATPQSGCEKIKPRGRLVNPLRAAIAALIVIWGVARAIGGDAGKEVALAEPHRHDHSAHDHDHAHGEGDASAEQAGESVGGLRANLSQNWALAWLGAYCVAIIGASLVGGWLPQLIVLSHDRMQWAISFIGGLMLGIGVFHMLPHALVELGEDGPDRAANGMMAGLVVMFFLLRAFHFHHHGTLDSIDADGPAICQHDHDHDNDHGHQHSAHGTARTIKLSWVGVFLGMAFHSIGDGLALGASMEADVLHGSTKWIGLGTFWAVLLHKPVDSISVTTLMAASGWSRRSRMFVNVGFSLICPLGALLFVLGVQGFSDHQALIVGLALSVSAGVFICIALADLLPEMEFHTHNRIWLTLALLAGVAIAWGIRFLEPPHAHSHSRGGVHSHDH
jgi:zinc and cadmium transporter